MKNVAILLIIPVVVLALAAAGCDGVEKGVLPVLQTGDRWVSWTTSNDVTSTMALEVTGETVVDGRDCYVLEGTADPPYLGIISDLTMAYEKTTFLPLAAQSSGQYMATPYEVVIEATYELGGDPLFPLRVGNEHELVEERTTTATIMGDTATETETETSTRRVEKLETITVPAGTFECFKLVEYDEDGVATNTTWYSDEVKWIVQETDHESGESTQLVQYSLN
jgi:hypothetical protein